MATVDSGAPRPAQRRQCNGSTQVSNLLAAQAPSLPKLRARVRFSSPAPRPRPRSETGALLLSVAISDRVPDSCQNADRRGRRPALLARQRLPALAPCSPRESSPSGPGSAYDSRCQRCSRRRKAGRLTVPAPDFGVALDAAPVSCAPARRADADAQVVEVDIPAAKADQPFRPHRTVPAEGGRHGNFRRRGRSLPGDDEHSPRPGWPWSASACTSSSNAGTGSDTPGPAGAPAPGQPRSRSSLAARRPRTTMRSPYSKPTSPFIPSRSLDAWAVRGKRSASIIAASRSGA